MSPWLVCRVAVCCATSRHLSVVIIVWTVSNAPSHKRRAHARQPSCQTAQDGDTVGNAPLGSTRFLTTEETCLGVPAALKPPEARLRQPPTILCTRPLIVSDRWSTLQPIE